MTKWGYCLIAFVVSIAVSYLAGYRNGAVKYQDELKLAAATAEKALKEAESKTSEIEAKYAEDLKAIQSRADRANANTKRVRQQLHSFQAKLAKAAGVSHATIAGDKLADAIADLHDYATECARSADTYQAKLRQWQEWYRSVK